MAYENTLWLTIYRVGRDFGGQVVLAYMQAYIGVTGQFRRGIAQVHFSKLIYVSLSPRRRRTPTPRVGALLRSRHAGIPSGSFMHVCK
jgi:hypothetical protein